MKKENNNKILMWIIFLVLFVLGCIVLTFGNTDRYDGIIKGDEPAGMLLICSSIVIPLIVSFIFRNGKAII